MKCSNCSNEMVRSRAGWLCISCGHIEAATDSAGPTPQIALGKDSHEQMRNAQVADDIPVDNSTSTDDKPAAPDQTDAPVSDTPTPPIVTTPPWEPSTSSPTDEPAGKADESTDASDSTSTDTLTVTPAVDPDTVVPSPDDLSAVEAALAKVEKPAPESSPESATEVEPEATAEPESKSEESAPSDAPSDEAEAVEPPKAESPVPEAVAVSTDATGQASQTPEPADTAGTEEALKPSAVEPEKVDNKPAEVVADTKPEPAAEPVPEPIPETKPEQPESKEEISPKPDPEGETKTPLKLEDKVDTDKDKSDAQSDKDDQLDKAEKPAKEDKAEKADSAKEPEEESPAKIAHNLHPKQHRTRLRKKTGPKFLVKDVSAPTVPVPTPVAVKADKDEAAVEPAPVKEESAGAESVVEAHIPLETPDAPIPERTPSAEPVAGTSSEITTHPTPEVKTETKADPDSKAESELTPETPEAAEGEEPTGEAEVIDASDTAPETLEEVEHDETKEAASDLGEEPAVAEDDLVSPPASAEAPSDAATPVVDEEPAPEVEAPELASEPEDDVSSDPVDEADLADETSPDPVVPAPVTEVEESDAEVSPLPTPETSPSVVADDVPATTLEVAAPEELEDEVGAEDATAISPVEAENVPEAPVDASVPPETATTDPATPAPEPASNLQGPSAPDPVVPAVTPVASTTAVGSGGKPPVQPVTHPKPFKLGPLHLIGALIVIVMIALLAYVFFIQPKLALGGYLEKVATSRATTFAANITESSSAYNASGSAYGVTDLTTSGQAKVIVNVSGNLAAQADAIRTGSKAVSGPVSGELVAFGPALYFKTSTTAVVSGALAVNLSPGWYKYDLGSSGSCTSPGNGPGSFLSYGVLSKIPVQNAAFTGIGKVGTTWALKYRGQIDTADLSSAVRQANQNLSSACQIKLAASDYQNVTINYNLWRGLSADQLDITATNRINGATTHILLTTLGYNVVSAVKVPSGATDADNLFKKVLGASTHPAPASTSTSLSPNEQASQIAVREANLASYLGAYKARSANGFYPVSPPALTVQIVDPTTGRAYVVSANPLTAVGQIQYVAGGSCTGPDVTPGKTGTRYLAIKLLPSPTSPAYCLDAR
jgi:hypothetical protein